MLRKQLIELVINRNITRELQDAIMSYLNSTYEYDGKMLKPIMVDLIEKHIVDNIMDEHIQKIIEILSNATTKKDKKINTQPIIKPISSVKIAENISEISSDEYSILQKENKELYDEMQKIKSELLKYKKLVTLTEIEQLNYVEDKDINELYIEYKNSDLREFGNAFIVERDGMPIIPKQFYIINK